jgi:hypothetical protein
MEEETPRQRRTTSADVTTRRAARALITPFQDQIGLWQAETIKFETMVQRGGRVDSQMGPKVQATLDAVVAGRTSLDAALSEQPDAVRLHTRVTDTAKVLKAIEDRLNRIQSGLPDDQKR